MSTDKEKSWFARLQEKLAAQPRCTPEERDAFAAERKESEGTMWEWAQMQPSGEIAIRITQYGVGGTHGVADYVVALKDENYEKCRIEYGLDQPGDTRHIMKRWLNGSWVLEKTEKTNSNLPPPKHSTEGKHSQAL